MSLPSVTAFLSALGAAWLPVLLDATVKGTVILLVASVVSLLVRRASAAARHLVWFLALVGLLGLPALSVALPGWQVLPGWFGVGQTAARDAQGAAVAAAAVGPALPPAADSPLWSAGRPAGRPEAPLSPPGPLGAASGTPPAPAAEVSRSWSAMDLWIWILPLWATGAAVALTPVLLGMISLWRLGRGSRQVTDGSWAVLLERLSAALGLKRPVMLLQSGRRSMPMAWGLVRPKLLIPDEAEGWSSECLRAVLLHELAHIRRWDCLTQLVARMACGLYWFNPLAWLALHRMVAEHERACDDVVLAAGGRAPEYAEHLLEVASRLPAVPLSLGVGIALARPSRLEGRLLAILDGQRSRRAVTRAAVLAAVVALAAVAVPLAVLRPMVQAEQAAVEKTKDARTLDLTYTNVTDAGLKELEGLKGLRELHCVGAAVTEAGVERLRKALPQAKITAGEGAGARPTLEPPAKSGEPSGGASATAAVQAVPAPTAASDKPAPGLAATDEVLKQLTAIVELEERILAGVQERHRVGMATAEEVDRQQVRLAEARLRLARLPAISAAAPGTSSDASMSVAPPHPARRGDAVASPAATPILKVRSTDGAAVADVHNGAVRVRLGDNTLEAATIIISLDSVAGGPRKGIVLGVRDGAVRMSAEGAETLGAKITFHPDGRVETSSREAAEGSLKRPAPAGPDAARPVEPGRAEPGNALPPGGAAARADRQVFTLTYREADETDGVVRGNTFHHCLPARPAEAKAVPADLSGRALYFLLPIGGRKVPAVLDPSPTPRLFVDVAGTGDLSAAGPLPAKPWGPTHQFGPVAIPVDGQAGRVVRVRFLSSLGKDDKDIAVAPAGYVAGEINLDWQPYRVALVDHSLSGRYDNVLRREGDPESARGETYLAIDLNQDGRLEPPGASASETFDLLPALCVRNAYYSVQVAPDGSSIALAKAEPEFGTLDTGCADLGLSLVGEYGFRKLSGSGGKWQIPDGWHAAAGATLTRSDGAGTPWSLHGVSSWGRLARFDIRAGQRLSLRAGPPLSVKVHPSGLQPNGMIHMALALVGQAGEDYNAAARKGGVPQPPRFRILDEAGGTLASGQFNAGSERTYSWCWWRVPEGFRGKYRVEVEGDWGPFEVSKEPPEWFSVK